MIFIIVSRLFYIYVKRLKHKKKISIRLALIISNRVGIGDKENSNFLTNAKATAMTTNIMQYTINSYKPESLSDRLAKRSMSTTRETMNIGGPERESSTAVRANPAAQAMTSSQVVTVCITLNTFLKI